MSFGVYLVFLLFLNTTGAVIVGESRVFYLLYFFLKTVMRSEWIIPFTYVILVGIG